jgi:death-on-curing protein
MHRITVDYLMAVHGRAIDAGIRDEAKLKDAVRDIGTLEYIADKANRIRDELERAAFMMYSVANYHPFVEGNKRTALLLAETVLKESYIDVDGVEMNRMVRKIAAGELDETQTKKWMTEKSKRYVH